MASKKKKSFVHHGFSVTFFILGSRLFYSAVIKSSFSVKKSSSCSERMVRMEFDVMTRYDNTETDSPRPIPDSTSDIIIAFTPEPTPCSRSSLSHTHRSMVSFGTKPLPFRQQILRDLLTIVYLTTE
jgi:hypothetical protein